MGRSHGAPAVGDVRKVLGELLQRQLVVVICITASQEVVRLAKHMRDVVRAQQVEELVGAEPVIVILQQ